MAYGMQIFADDGINVIWDSTTSGGGVIIDSITLPPNTSLTKNYPIFIGRELLILTGFVTQFYTTTYIPPTISYIDGVPTVNFYSTGTGGTYIIVVR